MAANITPPPACLKADVWEHFGLINKKGSSVLDRDVAVCLLCHANVRSSGNTTNLREHLKRHHSDKVTLTEPGPKKRRHGRRQSARDSDGGRNFHWTSTKSLKITDAIVYFICKDLRPFSVVENAGFRSMVKVLDPHYSIVSREHLAKVSVPEMYSETKAHVRAALAGAERVALTCDGWTWRTTDAYVTVTAHFINDEWELVSYVLQTKEMPESHLAHNLARFLQEAIAEWGIAEKDPVVVTDEAAFKDRVKCYAHTLNQAARSALGVTEVAGLLERVRRVVNFFRRSTAAKHTQKDTQKLLRLPGHKLLTDVATRWNSSHDMLERFLEQQPAICAALFTSEVRKTEEEDDLCTAIDSDVTTAEEVVGTLKPMKEATQYMSEEKTPTLSVVAPLQDTLISRLKPIQGDSEVIKEMKAAMADELQKRYTDLRETLHACSAMDPRFKSLPFLTEDERQEVYDGLTAEAAGLVMHAPKLESLWSLKEEGTEKATAASARTPKPSCPLAALLGEQYGGGGGVGGATVQPKTEPQEDQATDAMEQMSRYRQADLLKVKEDPLVWWKEHQLEYPLLSQLAKRYLCIPGTSVSPERVFSVAGDIIAAQRSELLPEHIDQMLFLNKNLKRK